MDWAGAPTELKSPPLEKRESPRIMHSALNEQPRVALAHTPTPLEPLDRLSEALGGPRLWAKRDDCTGLGTGGNKTRKLEYLLGRALEEQADTVITFGAVQSNHARQTAAACARIGLPCHLILARKVPWQDPTYERLGNVLLDRMFGAELHLVDPDQLKPTYKALLNDLDRQGRKPYVIPTGGSNGTGALGYVRCALELDQQLREQGVQPAEVLHATSSAGTQGGLLAGFHLIASEADDGNKTPHVRVQGINVSEPPEAVDGLRATIAGLATDALTLLGAGEALPEAQIHIDSDYLGEGYGLPTPETLDTLKTVASLEGILLDPVYSGKAMSGLIGRLRAGHYDQAADLVFLHTGGAASLPVYEEAIIGS